MALREENPDLGLDRLYQANLLAESKDVQPIHERVNALAGEILERVAGACAITIVVVSLPWLAFVLTGESGITLAALIVAVVAEFIVFIVLGLTETDRGKRSIYYLENWRDQLWSARPIVKTCRYILLLRKFEEEKLADKRYSAPPLGSSGLAAAKIESQGGTIPDDLSGEFEYASGVDVILHEMGCASHCVVAQRRDQDLPIGDFRFVPILGDDWKSVVSFLISHAGRLIVSFDDLTESLRWELAEIARQERDRDTMIIAPAGKLGRIDGGFTLLDSTGVLARTVAPTSTGMDEAAMAERLRTRAETQAAVIAQKERIKTALAEFIEGA
jgi:hypothetical protein